jgi:hypothetical protein
MVTQTVVGPVVLLNNGQLFQLTEMVVRRARLQVVYRYGADLVCALVSKSLQRCTDPVKPTYESIEHVQEPLFL